MKKKVENKVAEIKAEVEKRYTESGHVANGFGDSSDKKKREITIEMFEEVEAEADEITMKAFAIVAEEYKTEWN